MWEIISSPSALVFERPPPLGRTPPSADDFTLDVPLDIGTDPARVAVRANLTCTVKLPRRADGGPGRAQMAEDQVAVLGFRVVPSGVEVLPRYYFVEQHPGRGSLQADAISLYHHTP